MYNFNFFTMKHNHASKILITFLVLFQFLLNGQELEKTLPEEVGVSSERINNLTNVLQEYVNESKISGAVALIVRKNKIIYFNSVGMSDFENNKVMEKDAIFRIASQTKAIVSAGIMILQEEGKLLISDPLWNYIPEFKETKVAVPNEVGGYEIVKANRAITLRDLLTHTAGIGYGGGVAADLWKEAKIQGWYFADRNEPILETVKRMGSLPFDAQPGEQFVYGYSTDILGAVIEVVSGQTLASFLQDQILDPLDMKDTYFYLPENKKNRLATVYSSGKDGIERTLKKGTMVSQGAYVEGPKMSYSGGAGLLSTAMDYAKFLQMTLNGGTYSGKRILSRKSIELMTTNHLDKASFDKGDGTGFGLGFSVLQNLGLRGQMGSVGEYGWGGAYHSTYWVDPQEELVVVYFTQLIPAQNIDDHGKLRVQVYQAIID
ncbi:MAG: CubicO group peptidase (beta-lactamase class C family) [Psychroserpens sp.]|jgi:CubicO group peptidase (beta-lactamase class C family)